MTKFDELIESFHNQSFVMGHYGIYRHIVMGRLKEIYPYPCQKPTNHQTEDFEEWCQLNKWINHDKFLDRLISELSIADLILLKESPIEFKLRFGY